MPAIPDWVKPNNFVIHKPSNTVFMPERCRRQRLTGNLHVVDPGGDGYPLEECDRLNRDHLASVTLLVTSKTALTLIPCNDGVIVSNGKRRLKVLIPAMATRAAESLAEAFDGAIYTEESSNGHYPDPE